MDERNDAYLTHEYLISINFKKNWDTKKRVIIILPVNVFWYITLLLKYSKYYFFSLNILVFFIILLPRPVKIIEL